MGRSSGKNKTKRSARQVPRSSIIENVAGQQVLFDSSEMVDDGAAKEHSPSYTPAEDHQVLVEDALSHWLYDTDAALEPRDALYRFRLKKKGVEIYPEKNKLAYWEKAKEALLYQVEKGVLTGETLFRGQPFSADHPLDRARSWSKNLQKALHFATSKFYIIAADGSTREETSKSDIRLNPGDRVFLRLYSARGVKNGIDVNQTLEEKRKNEVIDRLINKDQEFKIAFFNGEKYVQEDVSLKYAKERVLEMAEKVIDPKKIEEIIESQPEYKPVDPNNFYQEREISILAIEQIISETESSAISRYWDLEKEKVIASIKEKKFAQFASNSFYSEDEVIIHPSEEQNIRRIDVFVGDDEEEIKNTPLHKISWRILESLDSLKGDHVSNAPSHQQQLFTEGIDF